MAAKGLAKLAEELGELQQVVGKKLAYYHTDVHPDGGPPLSERMQDEMGDVMAAIDFVVTEWGLDDAAVEVRRNAKFALFEAWDAQVDNNTEAVDRGR